MIFNMKQNEKYVRASPAVTVPEGLEGEWLLRVYLTGAPFIVCMAPFIRVHSRNQHKKMMLPASHTWVVMKGLSLEVQVSHDRLLTWPMGSPGAHTKVLGNSGPIRGMSVAAGSMLR